MSHTLFPHPGIIIHIIIEWLHHSLDSPCNEYLIGQLLLVMRVAVIGGGPPGLVTLNYPTQASMILSCEPVEVRLFEYQAQIGGILAARSYEDTEVTGWESLCHWPNC
jgi:hypothetical protein